MKKKYILLFIPFLVFSSVDCLSQKVVRLAKGGNVMQTDYLTKIPFRYEKNHIFIDVFINGTKYNFLFDTGADFCIIDINHIKDVDYKKVKTVKNSGSSFKTQKSQLVEVSNLSIFDIDFNEIGAAIMDLSFINADYSCSERPIAGIIGANLMRKAIWQINYLNREILISDSISNFSISESAHNVEMIATSWGSPKVTVNIDGMDKKFIFDTGSGGKITTGTEFLQELDTINLIGIDKEDQLNKPYTNYLARTDTIQISNLILEHHTISLEDGVSSLIGNKFFENFILTFDWQQGKVFLDPTMEFIANKTSDFAITLKPNYTTNKIEINGVYKNMYAKNKFSLGTEILKMNETDVTNFSKKELCDFWETEWEKIKSNGFVRIETANGKIELEKMNLIRE